MVTSDRAVTMFAAVIGIFLPWVAAAHHSTYANFDKSKSIELEGEITRVLWRNPHVRFTIKVLDDAGQEVFWNIETTSVSHLRNQDVPKALIQVGDKVRLAGNPSLQGRSEMWVTNLLLSNGKELVIGSDGKPIWSDQVLGKTGASFARQGDASNPSHGVFGVWSHTVDIPMLFPETVDADFDVGSYPMTGAARATFEAFDAATDNPTANCAPKGMPIIMEQPYPMEISRDGENIKFRIEEYDTVRFIHMNAGEAPGDRAASRLGYSVGHWDDNALVVETSMVNWGHFNQLGVPLTGDARITERFTPSDDGSRLDYKMTVEDPATFTRPVELGNYWLNVPGVEVQPYECTTG